MSFGNMLRIKQLEANIQEYAQKYYTDGSSPVSDEEFDAMVDELRKLSPTSRVLKDVGWGYDIDLDTTFGEKRYHKYGLVKGLDKCHNAKELGSEYFDKFTTIYTSLKLDGISVVLYYHEGVLVQALTRGDGEQGIDITKKAIRIDPSLTVLKNDKEFTGAVRGEILMSYENFEKFQKLHPEAKNGRNSTAGLINNKELSDDLKYLDILVYTVVGDESYSKYSTEQSVQICSMPAVIAWLNENFNKVAPYSKTYIEVDTLIESMNLLRNQWYGKYPADGVVITRNVRFNISTGQVQYDAKAFKFPAESKITTVEDVEWSLTKTKYLVPKVKLTPVNLSGTTVTYATGYNARFIVDNKIGPEGEVEVRKSGEIIPQILKVIKPVDVNLPTTCPECGHTLIWSGVHLQCPNDMCGNAATQDLLIWLKNLAPVDGLGDTLKLKFIEDSFGKDATIEDVMNNRSKFDFISFSVGAQRLLISNMFSHLYGIDDSTFDLVDCLMALNIPRLGDVSSMKLAGHTEVIKHIVDTRYSSEAIIQVKPIVGEATCESLLNNVNKLKRLDLIIDRIDWEVSRNPVQSKGKVAITGKLSVKRSDFETELRNNGWSVGDISKDTKFLITDDPTSASSKNQKADKLGITKITEADFRTKYMKG